MISGTANWGYDLVGVIAMPANSIVYGADLAWFCDLPIRTCTLTF